MAADADDEDDKGQDERDKEREGGETRGRERAKAKADEREEPEADDAKPAGEGRSADEDERPAPRKRERKAAGSASRAARKAEASKPATARPRRRKPGKEEAADAAEDNVYAASAGAGTSPTHVVTVAQERAARRALLAGGLLSTTGLALVGTGPSEAGTALCIAGLLALIYGIHTFGRLGPEPAK